MILASEERIMGYTREGVWDGKTLVDYFREHARNMPERAAVIDPLNKKELMGAEPERVSYASFERALDAVASALRKKGIGKDDIVVVQMPNCWELALLYLALARAGGVISPVPMAWRSKEISYVCELTRAKALITVEDFHGFAHADMGRELVQESEFPERVLTYEDVRGMTESDITRELDRVHIDGDDIFSICWTSGTEAQPKGCPLSHNNWKCQSSLSLAAGLEPGDTMLTAGPLVNMASVGTVYVPWILFGGTVVLHHPFDPQLFLKQMVSESINYTLLVPAVINMILKHPMAEGVDLSSIRSITVGSAAPSLWSMEEFKKRWNIDMGNIWGQNEGTAIISGVRDVPDMNTRVDSLPRYGVSGVSWSVDMANHIQTKLVDANGDEVREEGAVGELLYRGPNVMPGYFERPDLNEKAFDEEGYFRTGDLFQIVDDRHIRFFERAKDIIIRGGYNISAQEIENVILAHPRVQEIAAVGVPDENLGERVCVCVVPAPGESVDLEDVTGFMTENGCAVYKLPERLEVMEHLPRNPVGKLLKKDLRDHVRQKVQNR